LTVFEINFELNNNSA